MSDVDAGDLDIARIEYESLVFSRHQSELSGRSRRTHGVLDQSAYTLLTLLEAGGPASIGELSAITGLDASTLNRQTAALLRDGYAERIPDPEGGMARKFRMTPAGRSAAAEERQGSRRGLQSLLADWSPQDREAFGELLGRFNRSIEDRSGRAWPRP